MITPDSCQLCLFKLFNNCTTLHRIIIPSSSLIQSNMLVLTSPSPWEAAKPSKGSQPLGIDAESRPAWQLATS